MKGIHSMTFTLAAATNIGTRKNVNQDSYMLKKASTSFGDVCLAVMCDGMGGLADGEVASQNAIAAFDGWFTGRFPQILKNGDCNINVLGAEMDKLISDINSMLVDYGTKNNIHVGTTTTALLLSGGNYYLFHVGDSRCYICSGETLTQLSDDDSLAAQKMRNGEITPEEFVTSREKHILVQCVGVNDTLSVRKYSGTYQQGDCFLLCCDGLYNKLTPDEIKTMMQIQKREKSTYMPIAIEKLIDTVISRGETDNITGLLVNVV